MANHFFAVVYFFYGLAFYSMGLLVAIEGGRSSDPRLRRALPPLAAFGFIHGIHEWMEMFSLIGLTTGNSVIFYSIRLAILSFSFLSLAAFGSYLLAKTKPAQRLVMLVPLGLEAVWVTGLLVFQGKYAFSEIWSVADVWTRYSLAIPASLLSSIGLIAQQRAFRRAGLVRFGQDALLAAIAFGWYGLIGQIFPGPSSLPPSNTLNSDLFLTWFGFPIQLLRAIVAVGASIFVIRFLRAFQVEINSQLENLQTSRIKEAEEKQKLKSELFKRVVAAQESERQRIARELHDETGQALTALGMGLRGVSSSIQSVSNNETVNSLRQLENLTTQSLNELQRLISDLRPSHLDDLGLSSAVRWYASDIEGRTSLKVTVDIRGKERDIDPGINTTVFRIIQEGLTNVIKHADAKSAQITLEYGDNNFIAILKDDGKGFNLPALKQAKKVTWGLKNIEERVTLFGGEFSITSEIGKGTTIFISLPYNQSILEEEWGSG